MDLDRIRAALARRGGPKVALVFGSQARGDAGPGADLDLAVLGEDDPLGLAADLSLELGCEVDVVPLENAGYPLLQAVLRDGRFVYQGERGAAGRWYARVLTEIETDRGNYEAMREGYLRRLAEGR